MGLHKLFDVNIISIFIEFNFHILDWIQLLERLPSFEPLQQLKEHHFYCFNVVRVTMVVGQVKLNR